MSELVPADQIEQRVGTTRHPTRHYARAVSAEQTVYILHSLECRDSGIDPRDCAFSLASDRGIRMVVWQDRQDGPLPVTVTRGRLVPAAPGGDET